MEPNLRTRGGGVEWEMGGREGEGGGRDKSCFDVLVEKGNVKKN